MTREPGNGLPEKNQISIIGGMLVVEFVFADIGDRAIALSEIGEVKFTPYNRQPSVVEKEGDYIQSGDGWVPNPDTSGSIDIYVKRHKNDNINETRSRDFYFEANRRVWQTILNTMGGADGADYLFGERGMVFKPEKTVTGAVSK